jgi:Right handed beta helix region
MRQLFLVVSSLVLVVALIGAPAAAASATVSCGDRLSKDTKLVADLDCSRLALGSALVLVGNDITLDLNGHTILGPGDPASVSTFGVVVRGSRNTVRNGTISGFYVDAFASGGERTTSVAESTFERLTLTDASTAVSIFRSDGAEVRRNMISGVERGIAFSSSDGGQLANNAITARGRKDGPPCASLGFPACSGIEVSGGGGGARVRNNTIDSGGEGIHVRFRDTAETLIGNAVTCAADCIVVDYTAGGSLLERNSATAADGASFRIEGGSDYTLKRNVASSAINASGIVLSNVNDSIVEDNTADENGDAFGGGGLGLVVIGAGNLIHGNTANGNDLGGILSIGTNPLTANTARGNRGVGIEALEGAIDGGRNRASGNTDAQCVGVSCTP